MRDDSRPLYFIALIPQIELRDEIRAVKERISDRYGAGHALKSPAHITLQMPFKRPLSEEKEICDKLKKFSCRERPFMVELNGYGAFAPRVIFIKIVEPAPVRSLHRRLKDVLMTELRFGSDELMNDILPHVTVATRDLTREAFAAAWPELQDEEFNGSFSARSLFLLKHNGRNWDILEEFPFDTQ